MRVSRTIAAGILAAGIAMTGLGSGTATAHNTHKWPTDIRTLLSMPHECKSFEAGDTTNERVEDNGSFQPLIRIDTVTSYQRCHTTRYAAHYYVFYKIKDIHASYVPTHAGLECKDFRRVNVHWNYSGLAFNGHDRTLKYASVLQCKRGKLGDAWDQPMPFGNHWLILGKAEEGWTGDDVVSYHLGLSATVANQHRQPLEPHTGYLHGNGQDHA